MIEPDLDGSEPTDDPEMQLSRWPGEGQLRIVNVVLLDADDRELAVFAVGERLRVRLEFRADESATFPVILAGIIFRLDGVVTTRHVSEETEVRLTAGETVTAELDLGPLTLGNGHYALSVGLYRQLDLNDVNPSRFYDYVDRSYEFQVVGAPKLHNELVLHPGLWTLSGHEGGRERQLGRCGHLELRSTAMHRASDTYPAYETESPEDRSSIGGGRGSMLREILDAVNGDTTSVDRYWSSHTVNSTPFRSASASEKYLEWRFAEYPLFREFMGLWGDHTGHVVLDYGCGPGNDVTGFLLYSGADRVVGVDVSKKALELARARIELSTRFRPNEPASSTRQTAQPLFRSTTNPSTTSTAAVFSITSQIQPGSCGSSAGC